MAERTYGDWLDEQRRFGRSGGSDYGRAGMRGREEEGGREDWRRGDRGREDFGRGFNGSREYGGSDYDRSFGGGDYGRSFGGRDYGPDFGRDLGREDTGRMNLGNYGRGDYEYGDYGRGYGAYGSERFGRPNGATGPERFGREYGGAYARSDDRGVARRENYRPFGNTGSEDFGRGWGAERSGWGLERDEGRHHEGRGMFERMGERMREGARKLTGKGPKGYTRSDDRIREDVYDRLMRCGRNAEDVEVEVKNGDVTLRGRVDSRDDRRAIEDEVEDVLGVKDVSNSLRVSPSTGTNSETYVASTSGGRSTLHS